MLKDEAEQSHIAFVSISSASLSEVPLLFHPVLPSNIEKRWKSKTLEEKEKNLVVHGSYHPKNYALIIRVICPRDMPWPQNYKRYNIKGFRQHVVEVRNSGFVTV